jgi:hypothetical protein
MKEPEEVLSFIAEELTKCGISYMIVGSFASNLHGTPRATNDADIVVEIDQSGVERLGKTLAPGFYFDVEFAKKAITDELIFNAIHFKTGLKIDFMVRKQRQFSREEFQRKQVVRLAGKKTWFASAEDTILAKLEWSKKGESERQFLDAVNIAKVQKNRLDLTYLRHWADVLDVRDLLERSIREAGGVDST